MEGLTLASGVLAGFIIVAILFFLLLAITLYAVTGFSLMKVVETNKLDSKYRVFSWIPLLSTYVYVLIGKGTPKEEKSKRGAKVLTCIYLAISMVTNTLDNMSSFSDGESSIFSALMLISLIGVSYIMGLIFFNNYMKAFGTDKSTRVLYIVLSIFTLSIAQAVYLFQHRKDLLVSEREVATEDEQDVSDESFDDEDVDDDNKDDRPLE